MVYPAKRKLKEKFKQVQGLVASVQADVAKFYDGGNAAAGTRVRKAMQDLKVLAQEIRTEVTDKKIAIIIVMMFKENGHLF